MTNTEQPARKTDRMFLTPRGAAWMAALEYARVFGGDVEQMATDTMSRIVVKAGA